MAGKLVDKGRNKIKPPASQSAGKFIFSDQQENNQFLGDACLDSRFLNDVINTVADPIFVKDSQHRWIVVNDALCQFMGHTREELIGKSDYDFFPKKEADVFWAKDEAVFKTKKQNINEEKFTDAGGITHTIVTKKNFYTTSSGVGFLVGIISDITEQKRLESELRKKEEIYRKIFLSSPDAITISRLKDGLFIDVNDNLEKILGYRKEEIVGKTSLGSKIWAEPREREVLIKEIKAHGFINDFEGTFVRKDKRIIIGLVSAVVLDLDNVPHILSVTRDITERKKESEMLKEKLIELEKLNKLMVGRELKMAELKEQLKRCQLNK